MNGGVFIFAILFAVAGYGEAKRCRERYGRYPFGWPPVVWAVVMFLSWLIGLVLLAIAERIVRSAAAKMPQQMFVQPVPMQSMYAPPGLRAARVRRPSRVCATGVCRASRLRARRLRAARCAGWRGAKPVRATDRPAAWSLTTAHSAGPNGPG